MAYKPGDPSTPLPGTSSTGNTTGMPKVKTPAQRKLAQKNVVPVVVDPGRRPGAGKVIVRSSGGGRSNAARVAAAAAAKKAAAKKSTKTTTTPTTTPFTTTPTTAPATAPLAPTQTPLDGNYDPNSLDVTTSEKIDGLAGKIQLPNAQNYATSMANMQYGPAIQAVASRIKGLTAALPGALEALNKAFSNIDQAKAAQMQVPVTSGAGVANLFGGNTGAAAIAANQAVQANDTTANQIGAANDQTGANATRAADWATRIQLLNNMAVNQGRSDLAGEIGQRDSAKKGYYDQGLKMRGDMISQAISNQGALNNQKITAALASGQLESQGLTNQGKALQNSLTGTAAAYAPAQAALQLQSGKQAIVTSALNNQINKATATEQLKQLTNPTTGTGVTSLKAAFAAGGGNAIAGMIMPAGAVVADATTGRPKIYGDLNTFANNGVKNIMAQLPDSDPKKVKQYVANYLHQVASASNQWVYQGGRWKRVAQPKTATK